MVKDSVTALCLHILNDDLGMACVNKTLLTLIPSMDNLTSVSQFHPISLCNVVYKIVLNRLSIRLKSALADVISEA